MATSVAHVNVNTVSLLQRLSVFGFLKILLVFLLVPLPYSTDQPMRRTPWVTYTLIGLNLLVYAVTRPDLLPDHGLALFAHFGLPARAPHFLQFMTYMFLHVSLEHLFWNMMFLWLFGPHVEDALGRATFATLYIGGAFAAALLQLAIVVLFAVRYQIEVAPLVGASGAISSILAPYAVRFHRSQIRMVWLPGFVLAKAWSQLEVPALAGLGIWLAQNVYGAVKVLIVPASGGIAYWAHIGGFVFGLVAAELTNLLREGNLQYLLEDARASAVRGVAHWATALQKYRLFLDREPENAAVRLEFARALYQHVGQELDAGDDYRALAAQEFLFLVRSQEKAGKLSEALDYWDEAVELNLELALTSRERLHLGSAAEDLGRHATAIYLLRLIVAETPDAAEDEMARLKLGQLLLLQDANEAVTILESFLSKYPASQWTGRAAQIRAEAMKATKQKPERAPAVIEPKSPEFGTPPPQ